MKDGNIKTFNFTGLLIEENYCDIGINEIITLPGQENKIKQVDIKIDQIKEIIISF